VVKPDVGETQDAILRYYFMERKRHWSELSALQCVAGESKMPVNVLSRLVRTRLKNVAQRRQEAEEAKGNVKAVLKTNDQMQAVTIKKTAVKNEMKVDI